MSTPATDSYAERLDDNVYNDAYGAMHSTRKQDRHFKVLDLIKYGLLRKPTGNRVLNVGSGPAETCEIFVYEFLPYCDEIILAEPNTEYTKACESSEWYLNNKNKIKIINCAFEDFDKDNLLENRFDLIYMCHTIYYFPLKNIPNILTKLYNLLVPNTGYCTVSCVADHASLAVDLFRKVKPNFRLSTFVETQLKNFNKNGYNGRGVDRLDYFQFCDNNVTLLTKNEAINLFTLFIDTVLYLNDDYHNGIITENDKIVRDKAIQAALPKLLANNAQTEKTGKLDWFEPTMFHFFRKTTNVAQSKL